MSYAASKQNSENRIYLPDDVLRRVGKHLNESLDTREYIEPDNWIVSIQEAERILRYLPPKRVVRMRDTQAFIAHFLQSLYNHFTVYDEIAKFMRYFAFSKMKEVLENDFIDGWKRMKFYDRVMPESVMLLETLIDSTEQKQWCAGLLKSQLDILNRTLYNLARVYAAYHNAVPLINSKVTPNGTYDALYLTKELFSHKPEINETYTRLKGRITKYKEQIDVILRINLTDCHKADPRNKCISHCNGFWRVSVDYERDLRLYESLVIKQPLHQLNIEKEKWELFDKRIQEISDEGFQSYINIFGDSIVEMDNCLITYHDTHTTDTIKTYVDNLRKGKRANKLFIAGKFNKIVPLVDNCTHFVRIYNDRKRIIMNNKFVSEICRLQKLVKQLPLLKAWYQKMHHYINTTTDDDKYVMEDYFTISNHNSPQAKMVRGDERFMYVCDRKSSGHFTSTITVSSRQITSYKKTLEPLLQKTQLDGTLFRYV